MAPEAVARSTSPGDRRGTAAGSARLGRRGQDGNPSSARRLGSVGLDPDAAPPRVRLRGRLDRSSGRGTRRLTSSPYLASSVYSTQLALGSTPSRFGVLSAVVDGNFWLFG